MAPTPAKAGAGSEAKKRGAKATKPRETRKIAASRREPANPEERKASLALLLSHPVRVRILAAAHREPISPSGFAREHGLDTGHVSEHFRRLEAHGAIVFLRTEPGAKRGTVRKLYVGAKRGIITTQEWQTLTASMQKDIASAGLQDFVVVSAQAIETGSFNRREDFVLTWDEAELDELAWRKLTKMLRLVWKKVPALEEESERRLKKTSTSGLKTIVGLAAYEAPSPVETKKTRLRAPTKTKTSPSQ
jgi:DNA-binding transcriptional ArsR family regulator